jgi:ankyrin repeat protein
VAGSREVANREVEVVTKLLTVALAGLCLIGCSRPSHERNKRLREAAANGRIEEVRHWLAEGADVNFRGYDGISGSTPLHEAVGRGSEEIAKLLIAKGADVNAADDMGFTALFRAGAPETLELLIAAVADLDAKNGDGETVLDWSIRKKFDWKSDVLRKHGAVTGVELKEE